MIDWPKVKEIASSVNSGLSSAKEQVEKSIKSIEDNKEYQSIISLLSEPARMRAKQIDQLVKESKNAGRLAGVPFIAKDNFLVFGGETTAASNILAGFIAPYQATAINRLEQEGAICVAKANLDAFAHGGSTENSDYFTTLNPHDKTKVAGGSSGGSAAAVALGLAPFALGTDTGGSIRQPASFCGVVGFKPSYGVVSRSGVVAMGSSLDCIGPLTTNIEDTILIMDIMAGRDELDSTTIELHDQFKQTIIEDIKGKRIGVIKEYLDQGIDNEVLNAVKNQIELLRKNGAIISEVSLPSLPLALACYYIICPAEVSSNLSRYDGQRYGYNNPDAVDLNESYASSRGRGFGKEAKRRIMIGTYVLSSGYYDAYYRKAQTIRTKLINEFSAAFKQYDYLLGPVVSTTAFSIAQNQNDPLTMYLSDVMTVAANLVGIPAISLPIAVDKNSMPIGLQLMTSQAQDARLLSLALTIEGTNNK